jgi:putative DNA primase/helicase
VILKTQTPWSDQLQGVSNVPEGNPAIRRIRVSNVDEEAAHGKQHARTISDLNLENIPQEPKLWPQWVLYKLGPIKANGKRDKSPKNPRTGDDAKVNDPTTWGSLDEVVSAYLRGGFDGPGFVFTELDPFIGIDLDGCRDPQTGHLAPWALDIVQRLDSYTEASPSGTGVHILTKGKLPAGGGKEGQVEMYEAGRFFTMTGEHIAGTPTICEERSAAITDLYRQYFPHKLNGNGFHKGKSTHANMDEAEQRETLAELQKALPFIPAIGHEVWLQVGMGLHFVNSGEASFEMWIAWSKTCPEKFDLTDCHKRWRSFHNDGGITHKTIFALAIKYGWRAVSETKTAHESDSPDDEDKTEFHLTDLGNGERFVARHGENMRYCNPWKKSLTWDGTRWQLDNSQQVRQWARETVRAIYAEASEAASAQERKALAAHAMRSEQESRLNAMMNLAQMDVPILPEHLDVDLWLLNVANGTLDLRTGTLRQHQRSDLITKLIPIVYDPESTCPLWETFLDRIFAGNQELITFIWKAVGYSLTGLTIEQCFFLLYGIGSNGKSTFLDTLRYLTAEYGEQASFQTFLRQEHETIRNDLAKLRSCRFVAALEMEEGKRLAESLIKSLTGGDALTARLLFSEYFTFVPQFKIWLAANHKPDIRGTDLAIWRRVRLIPFNVVIPDGEQDKTLPAKLKDELPGILAWAVRGCLAWQSEGFAAPEAVTAATAAYREESDVLGEFLAEHCLLRPELQTPAADLYGRYQEWTKASRSEELSQKAFGARLRERGLQREKSNLTKRIVWHGIGLLTE